MCIYIYILYNIIYSIYKYIINYIDGKHTTVCKEFPLERDRKYYFQVGFHTVPVHSASRYLLSKFSVRLEHIPPALRNHKEPWDLRKTFLQYLSSNFFRRKKLLDPLVMFKTCPLLKQKHAEPTINWGLTNGLQLSRQIVLNRTETWTSRHFTALRADNLRGVPWPTEYFNNLESTHERDLTVFWYM